MNRTWQVWHEREPKFGMCLSGSEAPFNKENFRLVAVVSAEDIEDVFRVTNHIDKEWWANPEVLASVKLAGARSTSVGDIVVDDAGKVFRCASCGWKEEKAA